MIDSCFYSVLPSVAVSFDRYDIDMGTQHYTDILWDVVSIYTTVQKFIVS